MDASPDRWAVGLESQLHFEIAQLVARNARGVDRCDWDLMRSTYHPDAVDDHGSICGSPQELADYLASRVATVGVMFHFLGQTLLLEIDRERHRAVAETACVGYQTLRPDAPVSALFDAGDGSSGVSAMGVRYVDEFEDRDGDLRISRRTVVYEWASASVSTADPFLTGKRQGVRGPGDFSYAVLGGRDQA